MDNKPVMDVEDIKKILPHRPPFLFVDKVLEISEKKILAVKNVTPSDYFFPGHFPGRPVMPGVIITEAMAQAGGILLLRNNPGKLAFLMSVDNAKFRKPVLPNTELYLEIETIKVKSKLAIVQGYAKVKGETVAQAEITCVIVD